MHGPAAGHHRDDARHLALLHGAPDDLVDPGSTASENLSRSLT
jgi:hypothetical protein